MKALFLLPVLAAPMLMTGCYYDTVVYHRPARTSVVVVNPPPTRRVVVVSSPPRGVVFYTNRWGRYYWHGHRRVYVTRFY
jgi:hypothetical protein